MFLICTEKCFLLRYEIEQMSHCVCPTDLLDDQPMRRQECIWVESEQKRQVKITRKKRPREKISELVVRDSEKHFQGFSDEKSTKFLVLE